MSSGQQRSTASSAAQLSSTARQRSGSFRTYHVCIHHVPRKQHHKQMPCGVCGQNMERCDRFAFSRWEVDPRCALIFVEGAGDAGEERLRVVVVGETGRPRWGAVHFGRLLPRLPKKTKGAVSGGGGQQLRIGRLWEDVLSGQRT